MEYPGPSASQLETETTENKEVYLDAPE